MEVQSIQRTSRPKLRQATGGREEAAPAAPSWSGVFAFSIYGAWIGLLSGIVGLGLILAQYSWTGKVQPDFLRLNRHVYWMMPLTAGVLLSAAGLAFGLCLRGCPRIGSRRALAALVFLASLETLSAIEGMHWVATLVLAAGATSCVLRLLRPDASVLKVAVRRTLPVCVLITAGAGAFAYGIVTAEDRATALSAAGQGKPNVLLVVLDTVRADHLSLYGYHRPTTPNLDRISRLGIRFDQARSTAPYTMPSHASMFTGRWPHEMNDVQYSPLDQRYPTLAEYLRDRGFRTGGFVGNTYYCNEWFGLARGFSHYEDYPQRREPTPSEMLRSVRLGRGLLAAGAWLGLAEADSYDQRVTAADVNRRALDWLDRQANPTADAPFFLFVNYIDAHSPYFPPGDYARRFSELGKTLHGYNLLSTTQRKKLSENTPEDHQKRLTAASLLGDAYDDCIGYLDEQLGRLLSELDRRGVLDNTLVIVTSDHGEHIGEHELFGHATSLYQPLVHVPLVIVPPKGRRPSGEAAPGQFVGKPVSLRAIPATVLDVLGFDGKGSPFPGGSLTRTAGEGANDPVLSELDLKDHSRTTRPGQWHSPAAYGPMQSLASDGLAYIRNGNDREELYDLERDPADREDLASKPQFQTALERFRRELKGIASVK
ncbi:MAG: sulfatase [Isosphaeraceae bacterium]|nr:sulfatase [Isosphaeraceae bacterium]